MFMADLNFPYLRLKQMASKKVHLKINQLDNSPSYTIRSSSHLQCFLI